MSRKKHIPWWQPQLGKEEFKYLKKVFKNHYPNEGSLTAQFEKKIADRLGVKFAIATTSGTAAMFLSLKALDIGRGDEVIIPDVTFVATANAVDLTGATPVLVDIDPKTMNIDPGMFKKVITGKTKAVMPVHVSGRGADMRAIMSVASENGIAIIEDAAEAFMSKHQGRYLGTFGKTGCFSFSANKTITTGQGGAVVTNDEKVYMRLRELKDQGRRTKGTGGDDIHYSVGYNFKFTDLQAAIGLGQFTLLDGRIKRMRTMHTIYGENLRDLKEVSVFKCDINGGELPQWTDAIVQHRDELNDYLQRKDVDCRKFWFPIHTQAPYKRPDEDFINSTKIVPQALWFPSAYTLSDADVNFVCKKIREFYRD